MQSIHILKAKRICYPVVVGSQKFAFFAPVSLVLKCLADSFFRKKEDVPDL